MSAYEMCEQVLQNVKNSNLNFMVKETPFSVFITIRKKFFSGRDPNLLGNPENVAKEVIENLGAKAHQLEQENINFSRELNNKSLKLENTTNELSKDMAEEKNLEKNKAATEKTLEDTCLENQIFKMKSENILMKQLI